MVTLHYLTWPGECKSNQQVGKGNWIWVSPGDRETFSRFVSWVPGRLLGRSCSPPSTFRVAVFASRSRVTVRYFSPGLHRYRYMALSASAVQLCEVRIQFFDSSISTRCRWIKKVTVTDSVKLFHLSLLPGKLGVSRLSHRSLSW